MVEAIYWAEHWTLKYVVAKDGQGKLWEKCVNIDFKKISVERLILDSLEKYNETGFQNVQPLYQRKMRMQIFGRKENYCGF